MLDVTNHNLSGHLITLKFLNLLSMLNDSFIGYEGKADAIPTIDTMGTNGSRDHLRQ